MFETWSVGNPDRKHALKFLHLASHIDMVETDTYLWVLVVTVNQRT